MARLGLKAFYPKRFKVTTDSSDHHEAILPNSLDRHKMSLPLTKAEQPIPPTSERLKAGCIWRLLLICFFGTWWVGLSLLCPLGRPHAGFVVCQCVTNGLFAHRAQGRRKPKPGLLHHSDRGSQTARHEYRQHLSIMKMEQSLGRKGTNWVNSPTERFFRSLKHE
jgi:putative transposase